MASRFVEHALDKISKKYPNFSADSGKKVVDSIQDVYKTYRDKSKQNKEVKSAAESHSLIDIPGDQANGSKPPRRRESASNRDSLYSNCEDFQDATDSPYGSTDEFLEYEKSKLSGVPKDGNGSASYQPLSDNPPASPVGGAEGEKKELVCPPVHPDAPAVKPPDTPNISQYLQKKSMAQGMMDLALLSANTNQLRYILDSRAENSYFGVSLTLIITSLVMQVVVGVMLVWNSQYNVQRRSGFASADRINNLSVFGVFLITLINVFVSTFGNVSSGGGSSSATTTTAIPGSITSSAGGVSGIVETTSMPSIIGSVSSAEVAPVESIPID